MTDAPYPSGANKRLQFPGTGPRPNVPRPSRPTIPLLKKDPPALREEESPFDHKTPEPSPLAALPEGMKATGGIFNTKTGEVTPLPPEVEKALNIVGRSTIDGTSFILIGIKPTESGADVLTAMNGDPVDLRNIRDHLGEIVYRLYKRKGIDQ